MFGAFFMLNLALAVIWSEYAKAGQGIKDKKKVHPHTRTLGTRGVDPRTLCADERRCATAPLARVRLGEGPARFHGEPVTVSRWPTTSFSFHGLDKCTGCPFFQQDWGWGRGGVGSRGLG